MKESIQQTLIVIAIGKPYLVGFKSVNSKHVMPENLMIYITNSFSNEIKFQYVIKSFCWCFR